MKKTPGSKGSPGFLRVWSVSGNEPKAGGSAAAFPDDQGGIPDDGGRAVFRRGEELADRAAGVLLGLHVDGGQGGEDIGTEKLIVASDDRHILRQAKPHFPHLPHGAQGHQIVIAEKGCWPFPLRHGGQKAKNLTLSRGGVRAALGSEIRGRGEIQAVQLIEKGRRPDAGLLRPGGAAQKRDPPVAQQMKMAGGLANAGIQVVIHADEIQVAPGRADRDDGHITAQAGQRGP